MPVCLLLAACSPASDPDGSDEVERSTLAGRLQNANIDEASGLARSQRYPDVFWVANDDGPSVLYAIDGQGRDLGRVNVKDASNRDWEDLASFTLDGVPYLIAADIGDNDGERKDVRLYVIEEPEAGATKVDYAWRIEFTYPQGPRDAEAIAVDVEADQVLVLTKRDLPARLYALPLQPDSNKRQLATSLGAIASLPQPSRRDVEFAPRTDDWHWQPTSLDISDDGARAVVLTYGGVYLYERAAGDSWFDALQGAPAVVSRTRNRQAESVALNRAGDAIYITLEQRHAPLFRLAIDGGEPE